MGTLIPDIKDVDMLGAIDFVAEIMPFFILLCTITIIRVFFYEKIVVHQIKYLVQSGVVLFLVGLIQSAYTTNPQTFLLHFLPFITVGSLIVGIFAVQTSLSFVKQYSIPLTILVSFFIAISSASQNTLLVDQSHPSRNMIDWISKNTTQRESIVSTRINMPLLILANRKWVQYTSPFDDVSNLQNPPRYILISQQDKWYTGDVQGVGKITSYFFDDNEWYGIFEYSSSIE